MPLISHEQFDKYLAELTPLSIPVPDNFEDVLDYPNAHIKPDSGSADYMRYVSFYYTPMGDEAVYDDGTISGDASPWGFIDFTDYPGVAVLISKYDFGSSEYEGKHRLLLDRVTRKLYVGTHKQVLAVLILQKIVGREANEKVEPISPHSSGFMTIDNSADFLELEELVTFVHPTDEEINAIIATKNQRLKEFNEWLSVNIPIPAQLQASYLETEGVIGEGDEPTNSTD